MKKVKIVRMKEQSKDWRIGSLYLWSEPFNSFVDKLEAITVKPGESARIMEKLIAEKMRIKSSNVWLISQNDAE